MPGAFRELSGPFAKLWAGWMLVLLACTFLNVPPLWFLLLVLIPFLAIEIPGGLIKDPDHENNDIAQTLSEVLQRIMYQSKKPRWFPLSWGALAVIGVAGLLAWKAYWVVTAFTPFGGTADHVAGTIIGITIFAWNAPHWWDPKNFG